MLFYSHGVKSQTYFSQDFETGIIPVGWSQIYVSGSPGVNWEYQNGGHTKTPLYPYTRKPYPAHGGNFNALFQKESFGNQTTKLITPAIDLSLSTKPELDFWHAQAERYFFGEYTNDELRVYYRKSDTAQWVMLAEYTAKVETWILRTIQIPDSAISKTFYLAFEGKTKPGWGTCIDDIAIVEKGAVPCTVDNILAITPTTQSAATGSTQNRILRVAIRIKGNVGSLNLDSVCFNSLNTRNADIPANGVRLYRTVDSVFYNPVQLGTSSSFLAGKVSFYPLTYSLPTGTTYLWLTYDIDSAAVIGDIVDAIIDTLSIKIGGSRYPATTISPVGSRTIVQSVFVDNFETNKGWTLTGEFERTAPLGLGGLNYGNTDPASAFSGTNILGTDLTGLDVNLGDYEPNLGMYAYQAVSPSLNCFYFKDIQLQFIRWLNVDNSDLALIEVSNDNGSNWITTWYNESFYRDKEWNLQNIDIASYTNRMQHVKIRFTMGPTNNAWQFSGWNIDNFVVTGDYITNDVGVVSWQTPVSGCGKSSAETISVWVKNFAPITITNPIPVSYTIDGENYVTETMNTDIASGDSALYTFTTKADLSVYGIYSNMNAKTNYSLDEYDSNDGASTVFYNYPIYTLPYTTDFENATEYWHSQPGSYLWMSGSPVKSHIYGAYSGSRAWVTVTDDVYPDGTISYVESPCFNFSDVSMPVFEMKYISQFQEGYDGVALYYSINNTTWNIVPRHTYSWNWNWYTSNNVSALGTAGWDSTINGWVTAKQFLPALLAGQPNVKFRFVFASDASIPYDGFAFDDVKIYEAPVNAGVTAINSLANNCQFVNNDQISFTIQNFGLRNLQPGKDSVIAAYEVNGGTAVIDTIAVTSVVTPGGTTMLTFNKRVNIDSYGSYNVLVYTIDPYPGFYEGMPDHDSSSVSFTIYPNPVTNLPDTIANSKLNTVKVIPNYSSDYDYLWFTATNPSLSTDSVLNWPPAGKVFLKATIKDANSCSTTDTVYIRKLIPDVGVKTLLEPANACELGTSNFVKLTVKNLGDDTLKTGEEIRVAFQFQANPVVWDTIILASILNPGDTVVHTFDKDAKNLSAIQSYNFKTYTKYVYDSVPANDTLSSVVTVYGYPIVDIGPDTTVTGFYDMHTQIPFNTYLWNDGSTESTYRARFIGNHYVTVTDNHNCPASDTTYVNVIIHDLAMVGVVDPISDCGISNQKVTLRIQNTGTNNITTAENIPIGYSVNGSAWVNETVNLSTILTPGSYADLQLNAIQNFSVTGNYVFQASVSQAADIDATNNTLTDTVSVWGFPPLNLGPDSTVKALQYILSAPVGEHYTYKWQDNSTNRQFNVIAPGIYDVTVTDTLHNCIDRDTAIVIFKILDGQISNAVYDTAGCAGDIDNIKISFRNSGSNQNFTVGDTIYFASKINNQPPVLKPYRFVSALTPGNQLTDTLTGFSSRLENGVNHIKLYPVIAGDLRPWNDTLTATITISARPIVDIADDDSIVKTPPHILNAGSGTNYSYLWQNGNTSQTYTVTTSGFYKVKVTNSVTGCDTKDSVYVRIIIPDGGITYVQPIDTACRLGFNSIVIGFGNTGNIKIPAGETITFVSQVNNTPAVADVYTLTEDLLPGLAISYTITGFINKLNAGINNFTFYSVISDDIYPANDTMKKQVVVINTPYFDLGGYNDTLIGNAPVNLDAYVGSDYTYLWSNSATSSSISVYNSGWYSVTVTSIEGICSTTDAIYVRVLQPDGGITNAETNDLPCIGTFDKISITFKNLGDVTVSGGDFFEIGYIVNGSSPLSAFFYLTDNILPNDSIVFSFTSLQNKVIAGENNIKFFSLINGDVNLMNDTLNYNIYINPLPNVNLGPATITGIPPVELNTGLGSECTYLWNDGNTNNINYADSQGLYSVIATNTTTGCSASDSINVIFNPGDIGITSITRIDSACYNILDSLRVEVRNFYSATMPAGSGVHIAASINSATPLHQYFTLSVSLAQNTSTYLWVKGLGKKWSIGNNTIKMYSVMSTDVNHANDTSSYSTYINPVPTVNLADGQDTVYTFPPYVLNAGTNLTYNYLWQDGATTNTYTVYTTGTYHVKVTIPTTLCYTRDTVYVSSEVHDGSVVSVQGPTSSCAESIVLTAVYVNKGNVDIESGEEIQFRYTLPGQSVISESTNVSTTLNPGDTLLYTFGAMRLKPAAGSRTFTVSSVWSEDVISTNNSATFTLSILSPPTVNFGAVNDTIQFSPPRTLDAGAGFLSYSWNTSVTTRTITVNTQGWYRVTVAGTNGCLGSDSVYMKIGTYIINPSNNAIIIIYPNPASELINVAIGNIAVTRPIVDLISIDEKLVYRKTFDEQLINYTFPIDVSNFKKGVYILRVYDRETQKVFISKVILN
jgi:hypothetical protein